MEKNVKKKPGTMWPGYILLKTIALLNGDQVSGQRFEDRQGRFHPDILLLLRPLSVAYITGSIEFLAGAIANKH
jgi:hypothetical protein